MHKFLSLLYGKHVSHCLHNFRQLWKINTRSIKWDLETWRSSLQPAVLTKPFPSLSKTLNASLISSSISESLNSLGKDIAEAYFFCLTWSSARRIRWSWCRHRRLDQWQRPFPGSSWGARHRFALDISIISTSTWTLSSSSFGSHPNVFMTFPNSSSPILPPPSLNRILPFDSRILRVRPVLLQIWTCQRMRKYPCTLVTSLGPESRPPVRRRLLIF